MKVAVVSLGIGNVGSIPNALRKIGVEAAVTDDPAALRDADRLILPGVGAFDAGRQRLDEQGLVPVLRETVDRGTPLLGICLGMQLLADSSEEGSLPGLGWIPGRVVRFPERDDLRVPHMGWNTVEPASPLLDPASEHRYYFVHSYHFVCADPAHVGGRTTYGVEFASVVQRGHVAGVQFHPEKSHKQGLALLKRFVEGPSC